MTIFNLNLIVELLNTLVEKDVISKQEYNDILKRAHIRSLKDKAKTMNQAIDKSIKDKLGVNGNQRMQR